jgi:ABC-2 type transport system permease protein
VTVLHAEWTKVRTVPGTPWLLAGVVAFTVLLGALAASAMPAGGDPAKSALMGIALGQAVVVVLGVTTVSGEYGTGMIRTTLTAVPRRLNVLAAKGFVVTTLTLAAGTAAVLVSVATGHLYLSQLSLSDGSILRAAVGSVLYLGLIALLSIGVAALVRDAATAVGVVLALLYLTPLVTSLVSDPDWHDRLQKISPMTAGLAVQATVNLDAESIGPWQGLGVLALWAAGALLVGGAALRLRDV